MRVGIEIKPLSAGRYSYNDLIDTLRVQLVGQYLRDIRSRHGILVLFLLEPRSFEPEPGVRIGFPELLRRLSEEARNIEASHGYIKRVVVVGIECTVQAT